ncbi:MAG: hypothetical protein IPJ07_23535 [Acidobacteria bacterium]|nr:hypothetical protein [Acidobacteriota bacterium]
MMAVAAFAQTPTPPTRPSTAGAGQSGAAQTQGGGTGAEGKVANINTAASSDRESMISGKTRCTQRRVRA